MHTPRAVRLTAAVCAFTLLLSGPATAGDWPQFRGPNRDGVSRETGWLPRV